MERDSLVWPCNKAAQNRRAKSGVCVILLLILILIINLEIKIKIKIKKERNAAVVMAILSSGGCPTL
jgi:hypothetical protein